MVVLTGTAYQQAPKGRAILNLRRELVETGETLCMNTNKSTVLLNINQCSQLEVSNMGLIFFHSIC